MLFCNAHLLRDASQSACHKGCGTFFTAVLLLSLSILEVLRSTCLP